MTYHRKAPPAPLVVPDGPLGDALLRPCDAAAFLAVSEATLCNWRVREVGPAWIKMPSRGSNTPGPGTRYVVRYRLSDIIAMVDRLRVTYARMPGYRPGRPAGWAKNPERWESTSEAHRKNANATRQGRLREKRALENPADPQHVDAEAKRLARNAAQMARYYARQAALKAAAPLTFPPQD